MIQIGNLVRAACQPLEVKSGDSQSIDIQALGVVTEVLGENILVSWPVPGGSKTFTFRRENLSSVDER